MSGYVRRFVRLTKDQQADEINKKIAATCVRIASTEAFCNAVAETNALGWGVDECAAHSFGVRGNVIEAALAFKASGELADERAITADSLSGKATAVIDDDGDVRFTDVTAALGDY